MSLLRIYCSLLDQPQRCQWSLVNGSRRQAFSGEGLLADLPQNADRVQLVIPAAQVLIVRASVPHEARRHGGSVLAFAVEEQSAGEPDANLVSWLGSVGDEDALAVVDKAGLERWREALGAVGIRIDEIHCETLMLPIRAGEWSLAWNGCDGFLRTGAFEGAATDRGERESPPLFLRLLLEEAKARNASPTSIAIYMTELDARPDIAVWRHELGMDVRIEGAWDWRTASAKAGVSLVQQHQRWRFMSGATARLRPAAWMLGAALTVHAVALVTGWALLAGDQRSLNQQMESRFRAVFPDAVAVVDPALQMRRKLAGARHNAGLSDSGDFLPMYEQVAVAAKELPVGVLRTMSYEDGRMTLELAANEDAAVHRIVARLLQSGLSVDTSSASKNAAGSSVILTVRTS